MRWLPGLLVVAGVLLDVLAPPQYTGAPLFAAAPLVAAPLYSLRGTLLVATAAVLATVGVSLRLALYDMRGVFESVTEVLTLLVVCVLAVGINRVVRRGDARLASVRDVAEASQRALLPTPPERIAGLSVAARYVAAQADARIGGDLYAVQDTPHGVRLIMGDVRGKGMEAVEAAVVVIGAFREAAEQEASLEAVAGRLERALQREGSRREGLDQFEGFTTAVLAEYPADARVGLRVLNRGHPPPLLLAADGTLREIEPTVPALPLGMSEVAGWPDRAEETDFPPGSTLLLFTDGITEARNRRGVFYDPVDRLGGRVFHAPMELLDALVEDVAAHTGGETADDMALLAVRRPGPRETGLEASAERREQPDGARQARSAREEPGADGGSDGAVGGSGAVVSERDAPGGPGRDTPAGPGEEASDSREGAAPGWAGEGRAEPFKGGAAGRSGPDEASQPTVVADND